VRKLLGLVVVLAGVVLTTAADAAAGNGGIAPVHPESANASRIGDAYWLIMVLTGAIFLLVEISLIVFLIRFRGRGRPRSVEGPQIRGQKNLELAWTVVPVLILAAIAAFVLYKLPGIKNAPAATNPLRVTVSGRQFYWQFTYPNGVVQVDHLRVPVGRVVDLKVVAAPWDVIHSWWIPALGGKIDAIPGRTNHTWFRANRAGVYKGRCAEFCGIQHAKMLMSVDAVPVASFNSWYTSEARAQRAGTSNLGKQTWEGTCAKCHGILGQGLIGPAINGTLDRTAVTPAVRDGLQTGLKVMPPVGKDWSKRQLNALFAYMQRNISGKAAAPSGG
jgi:cytochrome c oxidase subunit 2